VFYTESPVALLSDRFGRHGSVESQSHPPPETAADHSTELSRHLHANAPVFEAQMRREAVMSFAGAPRACSLTWATAHDWSQKRGHQAAHLMRRADRVATERRSGRTRGVESGGDDSAISCARRALDMTRQLPRGRDVLRARSERL